MIEALSDVMGFKEASGPLCLHGEKKPSIQLDSFRATSGITAVSTRQEDNIFDSNEADVHGTLDRRTSEELIDLNEHAPNYLKTI